MGRLSALVTALLLCLASVALAGQTTVERTIVPTGPEGAFRFLGPGAGQPVVVREELAAAKPGREKRRRSLAYFAQLSDFQLTDEESPARVEVLDDLYSAFSSAHRPHEALLPHVIDASIRQVNALGVSPNTHRGSRRARMGFVITTGDNADNQQRNETRWVARLLQGGTLTPNSGSDDPAAYQSCPPGAREAVAGEAPRYTGVQDYDDYAESQHFYDPDQPAGRYRSWPTWPGLMDRAQTPFEAEGLDVPSYVAVGNHDLLAQGNEDAIAPYEAVGIGCLKPMQGSPGPGTLTGVLSDTLLTTSPERTVLVPPDPDRAYVTSPEYRALYAEGPQADAHGFAFVDEDEARASMGAANYYHWSPAPGLRFIAMDTVANGGVAGVTDKGNVDDPQFRWIETVLERAEAAGELVVAYSHHAPQSMTAGVPDEAAPPCVDRSNPQDDPNPGCDLDPRSSSPLHLADDLVELYRAHPNVIAWVAGHSHVNDVTFEKSEAGGFWIVRTSAEADWPHQDRLIEIMDNRDGTLSLLGTLIDNAAPVTAPGAGTPAEAMGKDELASIGRTIGFNDPQRKGGDVAAGEGEDRNVELLVPDPRAGRTGSAERRAARGFVVRVKPRRAVQGRRVPLRVRVRRNGRPVRGATVRAAGRRERTNRRGRAVLEVRFKRTGAHRVRARKGAKRVRRAEATVLVRRR